MDGCTHRIVECLHETYSDATYCHPWQLVSGTNLSGTDRHLPEGRQAG